MPLLTLGHPAWAPSAPPAAQPANPRSHLTDPIKDGAKWKTHEAESHVNNYFPAIIFISIFIFAMIALISITSADILAIKQQAAISKFFLPLFSVKSFFCREI